MATRPWTSDEDKVLLDGMTAGKSLEELGESLERSEESCRQRHRRLTGKLESDSAELVSISRIRIDGGTQTRAAIRPEVVEEYANALQEDEDLPPVTVFDDGKSLWLADGFHRYHAHVSAGRKKISVKIRNGTQRQALLYSAGCNDTHGLRRSNEDKRESVKMILADEEWSKSSNAWIAEKCRVSPPLVADVRESIGGSTVNSYGSTGAAKRVGRDGKARSATGTRPRKPPAAAQPDVVLGPDDPATQGEVDAAKQGQRELQRAAGLPEEDIPFDGHPETGETGETNPTVYPESLSGAARKAFKNGKIKGSEEQITAFARFDGETQELLVKSILDGKQTLARAIESGCVPDPSIEDVIKDKNAEIESFCRKLTKLVNDELPQDAWLDQSNRRDGAIRKFKDGCDTLRSCKCHCACPKCQGAGCKNCHKTGRVTKYQYDQLVG